MNSIKSTSIGFREKLCALFLSVGFGAEATIVYAQEENALDTSTSPGKIPMGCLSYSPKNIGPPDEALLEFDFTHFVFLPFGLVRSLDLKGWRIACPGAGRSALALSVSVLESNAAPVPEVSLARAPGGEQVPAQFSLFPDPFSNLGQTLLPIAYEEPQGQVTVLIDSHSPLLSVDEYNGAVNVTLEWPGQDPLVLTYRSLADSVAVPQEEAPFLNGRYSGQWVVDGLDRQGLVLQVGEINADRNFVFAVMFTYFNGQPTWVVGNADISVNQSSVSLEMFQLEGGEFFAAPFVSYDEEDVEINPVGVMTLRTADCNLIFADVDFSGSGFEPHTLEYSRLIDLAGYTCDQTR